MGEGRLRRTELMKEDNLLYDILNILPEEIECFLQAPNLENEIILTMMVDCEYDYYGLVRVNKANRSNFVNEGLIRSISAYIQNVQIRRDGALLFEGYDGVEFGIISKEIGIPKWFQVKYVPDTCAISTER